jgi:hypothetical protein
VWYLFLHFMQKHCAALALSSQTVSLYISLIASAFGVIFKESIMRQPLTHTVSTQANQVAADLRIMQIATARARQLRQEAVRAYGHGFVLFLRRSQQYVLGRSGTHSHAH